jgi:hypothetical protein
LFAVGAGFKEAKFSHVGIIVKNNPLVLVGHIYDKGENALHFETIKEFWRETTNRGVYRHNHLNIDSFLTYVYKVKKKKWKFDYEFSINNNKLYCSEFIYNILKKSGIKILSKKRIIGFKSLIEGSVKIHEETGLN